MDTDKIVQDLNRRFAAPLPEFYKRRVIVWYDEDKEFEDKLDDVVLIDGKIVRLTGSNNFEVKKFITVDDTNSNILLYNPISYDQQDDNWLLDIELYGEEFRADLISMWMDEMGIPSTPSLRKQIKYYRKYFNAAARRKKVANQSKVPTVPAQLHMAVMAAIAGLKDAQPNFIIHDVLSSGLNADENPIYREFVIYGVEKYFWDMVAQGTGYNEEQPSLVRCTTHILLTATTRTMRLEYLAGLNEYISTSHQAYCYDFISEWMHSEDAEKLYDIIRLIEDETKIPQRFMMLQVDDLVDTEIFPCINEVILRKLMSEINDHIIDVEKISLTVEKRRTSVWYDEVKNFYEGVLQVANMHAFYKEHSGGFHTLEPKKVWQEYTLEYYIMDTYYRQFHKNYALSLKLYNAELQDLFNHVMEKVEGLYSNWFLGQIGNNWSDACADDLRDYGHILEVPQQVDFYKAKVESSDTKMFVVISDALRYEVAVSLTEQLRRETKSKVDLSSMQATIPTITKFGMAALLPHKELTAEIRSTSKTERLVVLADGQSTEANNREKILKKTNPESVVLKYEDFLTAGVEVRQQRVEKVRKKDVVYIYHNRIDNISHADEKSVFEACDEAIEEIKRIVRVIVNEFGGTNIIITADHGFLYTYSPLREDDKVDKNTDNSQDVEYGRRYAIMQQGMKSEYLLPVKFLGGKTEFEAFVPRENRRIKMPGAGLNFVHGGISLQEMVVPVIEYHYLRNDSKEYKRNKSKYDTKPVELNLLSASHKVSNMIFYLNFYQTESVADNREAATYQIYFTDSNGKTISDVHKIIADKTSDNGQNRIFRCNFNLKSMKYNNTDIYYLVITDENGLQISREEFQIDIPFAVDEFDFFS